MTDYIHRVTIACPESMQYGGNHLALIMGNQPGDVHTFDHLTYEDGNSNRYAICSTVATANFLNRSFGGDLTPPEYAQDADVAAAGAALATMTAEGPARPDALVVRIDVEPLAALADMGLTRLPEEL